VRRLDASDDAGALGEESRDGSRLGARPTVCGDELLQVRDARLSRS
jgi:hypothetical protein